MRFLRSFNQIYKNVIISVIMAERLEDFNLPNSAVQKIIKESLPDVQIIAKDAKTALARAASVFVLYLTSAASQVSQKSNRKTLVGQDILEALEALDFEDLAGPLAEYYKGNYLGEL